MTLMKTISKLLIKVMPVFFVCLCAMITGSTGSVLASETSFLDSVKGELSIRHTVQASDQQTQQDPYRLKDFPLECHTVFRECLRQALRDVLFDDASEALLNACVEAYDLIIGTLILQNEMLT